MLFRAQRPDGRVDNLAVQVSDSTTTGAGSPARKDEAAGPGGASAVRQHGRSGPRFRDALKRGVDDERGSDIAGAFGVGGGIPPAPIRVAPPPAKSAAAPVGRVDRLLVGHAGGDAEARIRIGSGVLAGAEIRLTAAVGSPAVTAQLLTAGAGSRQTLSVAMEEIRLRLRDKGIALSSSVAGGRAADDARHGGHDGHQDRDAGTGGGWSTER
jgi:hypothetical protein